MLDGSVGPGSARSAINEMTMRQNNWTVGAYCAAYCRVVTTHHAIEDQALFPRLRRADPRLARSSTGSPRNTWSSTRCSTRWTAPWSTSSPIRRPASSYGARADELSDTLLSHLSYEERELVEPLARLGVLV